MSKNDYRVPAFHAVMHEYFAGAHRVSLPFGQWFVERYLPDGTTWPELFYEKDTAKAIAIVARWYTVAVGYSIGLQAARDEETITQ